LYERKSSSWDRVDLIVVTGIITTIVKWSRSKFCVWIRATKNEATAEWVRVRRTTSIADAGWKVSKWWVIDAKITLRIRHIWVSADKTLTIKLYCWFR